jgi:predicted Zn finger-like uncharacterized protein
VKFLCDRCKTRYSIGDERVRGKILKIRCKHCSNVITVREGMMVDPEGAGTAPSDYPPRAKKSTTMAPEAVDERNAPRGPDTGAGDAARAPALRSVRDPAPEKLAAGTGAASAAKDKQAASAARPAQRAAQPAAARPQAVAPMRSAGQPFPRGEPVNALGAAFASAMAKPPPALEEEWYVSIDGEQSGPFSLADAQRWVAGQAVDAELHCWSEGFDDWLPVDKVSHFRGLRNRPAAPPTPRPPAVPPRAGMSPAAREARPEPRSEAKPEPRPEDDEPKPLFAATMASLERGAPQASSAGLQLPPPATPRASATPAFGTAVPPRTNGAAMAPGGVAGARAAGGPATPAKAEGRLGGARPAGAAVAPARTRIEDPFDQGEAADSDSDTRLAAAPQRPDAAPGGPQPRQPRPGSSDAALTRPHMPASPDAPDDSPSSTLHGTGANPALTTAAVASAASPASASFDADDDLDIGEVSRVVNLADIVRAPRTTEPPSGRRAGTMTGGPARPANPGATQRSTGMNPSLRSTGMNPSLRSTGMNPSLRSTGAVPIAPAGMPEGLLPAPAGGDPDATMAPATKSHRRGLIVLLGVAILLVVGVILAVTFVVPGDDPTSGNLGTVSDIDTSRPEDPITHRPIGSAGSATTGSSGGGSASPLIPRPHPPRPNPPLTGSSHEPEPPQGDALRSDEIEDTARKHQDMTTRCYMRSQRGADAILVGDVKKIAVTLAIDKDGSVTEVQLSDHAADTLGKCLSVSMKGWKFRPSAGGRFRFSLNFVGS